MLVRKKIYVSVGVALGLLANPVLGQNQEQENGSTIETVRIVGSQADARAIAGSVTSAAGLKVIKYLAFSPSRSW